MGGNIWEWNESAFDGMLDDMAEERVIRGGGYEAWHTHMKSNFRHDAFEPTREHDLVGFRVAAFPASNYWLNVSVNGSGTINVVEGWQLPGTNFPMVATPSAGWLFTGWSGDVSGDYTTASTNLTMDSDKIITATFSDDADNDGLINNEEGFQGTDPLNPDSDSDALPDGWEVAFDLDPLTTNALADADADGREDLYEFSMGGDPTNAAYSGYVPYYIVTPVNGTNQIDYIHARLTNDFAYTVELSNDPMSGSWMNSGTSITGTNDLGNGFESITNRLTDPVTTNLFIRLSIVASNDVVYSAVTEITPLDIWAGGYGLYGTNAVAGADPDADGLDNAAEFAASTNPTNADSDGDGLEDGEEIDTYVSDPLNADTDADTFSDGQEVVNGGDPLVSDLWRVEYIRNNGEQYDLFSSNSVLDIRVGEAGFGVTNDTAWIWIRFEKSEDLVTWTNAGDEVYWSIPAGQSNMFYRVQAGR